jgi:hypothetical protein
LKNDARNHETKIDLTTLHLNVYRHPLTYAISDSQTKNNIFERGAEFLFLVIKKQYYEGGERILLGDNTRGGAIVLLHIRFHCDGIFQLD